MRTGRWVLAGALLSAGCGADFRGFYDGVLTQTLNCDDNSASTQLIETTFHLEPETKGVSLAEGMCEGLRFRDGGHPTIVEVDGAHTCAPVTLNGGQGTVTIKAGTLARATEVMEVNLAFDLAIASGGRNIACAGRWFGTLTRRWK